MLICYHVCYKQKHEINIVSFFLYYDMPTFTKKLSTHCLLFNKKEVIFIKSDINFITSVLVIKYYLK